MPKRKLKKLSSKAKKLIREHEAALAVGKAKYEEADTKLGELIEVLEVGKSYPMGDGTEFEIVDQFDQHDGPNPKINPKVWKPSGVSRYKGQIRRTSA